MTVADSGRGFLACDVGRAGALGLVVMCERAELLGGTFEVESQPDVGTRVRACWPLTQHEDPWLTPSALS
jgi:two-component system NarL family sensor kinase